MSDETKPDLPATTEDSSNTALEIVTEDTAGTDIDTVADLVSSLSLPTWIARNASKAFRQLCSAAVEWPSAFFKGKASERHAITAADTKITEAVTDQIIQQIKVSPEYAQIAVKKYVEKIIRELVNLDEISSIAASELKNGESDNPANQGTNQPNEAQSVDSTNQDASSGEEKTISDVWLNIFETEARPQSTKEGQILFGRILAGEIKQPGSYSMRTLKILGELDQNIASLFKNLCSVCVFLEHPVDKVVIDIRVPTLEDTPQMNGLRKYGLPFNKLNTLSEYGLIIPDYNSGVDYQVSIMDKDHRVLAPFQYQGQYWALLPSSDEKQSEEFRIWGVALSHVGRELFQIVEQYPIPEYTEDLKKYFAKEKLQMVAVPSSGPIIVNSTTIGTKPAASLENIASDKISV